LAGRFDKDLYFENTRIMEVQNAIRALSALAHESRLAIYRLLVQAGETGLSVGDIGEKLQLAPATLSFHLAGLRHAGLISTRRDGRTLYQAADYAAMNSLIGYLSENCCHGEACGVNCAPAVAKPSKSVRQEPRHEKTPRARRRH
jgi:DNA-binding transcriptional ArsR family regulator